MSEYQISVYEADDINGDPMILPALNAALLEAGAAEWPGRPVAMREIEEGPVVDDAEEELRDAPDDTIAGYLLLTRCEVDRSLPVLASCGARIEWIYA